MKTTTLIIGLLCLLCSGCTSGSVATKFKEFEALGVSEIVITGKFSNTEYKVTHEAGKRKATFVHSNAWLPKVYVVRETPDDK